MNFSKERIRTLLILITLFSFTLIFFRAFNIPFKERKTLYGDGYSDMNTYSAILYFKDHGFTKSYFLPMHNYTKTRDEADTWVYSHYPALPDILSGSYAKILNTEDEAIIRIIPIFLSAIMCLFVWKVLNLFSTNNKAICSAFIMMVSSNYFISFADNLHKHIYEEFFKWLILLVFIIFYQKYSLLPANRKYAYFIGLAFLFFLASNTSFEPITFLAFLTIGLSLSYQKKLFTPLNITLGLATILGFIAHIYQNSLFFGGWEEAINDMRASLSHRTLGKDDPKNQFDFIGFLFNILRPWNRMERMFHIPGWAFLYLCWIGFRHLYHNNKLHFKIMLTLLSASYSWYFLLPQHAAIHAFTVRQFGIFYILMCLIALPLYINLLKKNWREASWKFRLGHGLLIFYTFVMFLSQQVFPTYIKFGFFHGKL